MLTLIEWLRRLDEHVLRAFAPTAPATPRQLLVGYVLAGTGLLAVVAAVLIADHQVIQFGMLSLGLFFLVPFLHDGLEMALSRHR